MSNIVSEIKNSLNPLVCLFKSCFTSKKQSVDLSLELLLAGYFTEGKNIYLLVFYVNFLASKRWGKEYRFSLVFLNFFTPFLNSLLKKCIYQLPKYVVTLNDLWEHEFYVLAGTSGCRSLLYGKFLSFRKVSSIKNRKTINKNVSFFNFGCLELAKPHFGPTFA